MRIGISLVLLGSAVLAAGLLALLVDSGSSTGVVPRHDRSLSARIVAGATTDKEYAPAYSASPLDVQSELARSSQTPLAPSSAAEHGLSRLNVVPGSLEAAVQAFEESEHRTPSTRRTDPGVSLEDAIKAVQSEQTASVASVDVFANPYGKLK
ncbi:MAG: hypothetical protein ACOH2B_09340 [Burkholderiaceae bacterium]